MGGDGDREHARIGYRSPIRAFFDHGALVEECDPITGQGPRVLLPVGVKNCSEGTTASVPGLVRLASTTT